MNYEIYHSSLITSLSKEALKENKNIFYKETNAFIDYTVFNFIDKTISPNIEAWFTKCVSSGVKDIKLFIPHKPNKNIGELNKLSSLHFANGTTNAIVCFFEDKTTYFMPYWEFDELHKKWLVIYTEHILENNEKIEIIFSNPTYSFASVLERIKNFAEKIECQNFADIFSKSKQSITESLENDIKKHFYMLPEINLRLFQSASQAFVFGGMGSWNDEPSYAAFEYKVMEEYTKLSSELYENIILAILYAVNEW